MAASGFTPLIPYYSTTATRVPTTITLGELAVNVVDKVLFVGTGTNTYATLYNPAAVTQTGGTINGTVIGGTTPAAGTFTTATATSQFSGPGTGLTGTAASLSIGGNAATATAAATATTAGSATTVTSGGTVTTGNLTATGNISLSTAGAVTINAGASGSMNNVTIGGTTPAAGTFTTATATSSFAGPGTGLTGAAAALSIGGNAATATDFNGAYSFSALLGSTVTGLPNNTTIVFATSEFQKGGGNQYSTSNGQFTAPTTGAYLVTAKIDLTTVSAIAASLSITNQTASVSKSVSYSISSGSSYSMILSCLVKASSGDKIVVSPNGISASSVSIFNTSFFQAVYVGP